MPDQPPTLTGVYLFVRDLDASIGFYRRLGLTVTPAGDQFARAEMAGGLSIEFGTAELTRSYDPNWRGPSGPAPNTINFSFASSQAVDEMYADLTSAGYAGHLAPIDAFWGSRNAIVDDPDGNIISLHGPREGPR